MLISRLIPCREQPILSEKEAREADVVVKNGADTYQNGPSPASQASVRQDGLALSDGSNLLCKKQTKHPDSKSLFTSINSLPSLNISTTPKNPSGART